MVLQLLLCCLREKVSSFVFYSCDSLVLKGANCRHFTMRKLFVTKDSFGTKKHFTGKQSQVKYLSVTKKSFKILLSNEQPTLPGTSGKRCSVAFLSF